ncbi:WD40-repeat-containing domain protein [Rhodocollybia butyracea]|uniref:WD40-repeat-containing domain protein n=1 Tax=Rhodocollybia butyracea TaxID=206335 RepID=A0A9P5P2W3_9AGAR|nr:WD40-repeat-containing domain protein [Rhodocollybia butyracea]
MSSLQANGGKDETEEIQPPQRPPSPPAHTTFAARGVHPPTFSAFKPRDYRIPSTQAMNHVAWSCDGKKLAAVGIDKVTRMEPRSATMFSGGHSDDVDYVSWNPTHPDLFCTSSQKDRRIVFWDARQSRHVQQIALKFAPVYTNYAPDGKSLVCSSSLNQMYTFTFGKVGEVTKEQWRLADRDPVSGTTAIFNHTGTGLVLTHISENTFRVMDYPSFSLRDNPAAHVGGCVAVALDPRGRYLATGGQDSIVNLFDLQDWICVRTITSCDHTINALSFSFDGEYIAIANGGTYVDICATETGAPLHRIPSLVAASTVCWHPSKHLIAYCGQTKAREGGPPSVAVVSLFGLVE